MAKRPRINTETIFVRVTPELKERLERVLEEINEKEIAARYTQSSIIREGLIRELDYLEEKILGR